jgi:membrane fusion protein, multidrug efflux system
VKKVFVSMKKPSRPLLMKLLFIPPVVVGAVFLSLMVRNRAEPGRRPEQEVARVLRVIQAPEVEITPRALGYGTAEPGNVWQAVAEVKGHVIEVHADLEAGAIINTGAVVLKIDPREYQLTIARLDAEIDQSEAQLEELMAQQVNEEASLKIEQDSLLLAENELTRFRELLEKKAANASDVEGQQRAVLAQRQSVQTVKNSLNLKPSEMKALQATIAVKQAQRDQAELDSQKTVIKSPFNCRVGPVNIERGQFLAAGKTLFEAHNVDLIEVEAQVAPRDIRHLLQQPAEKSLLTLDMDTMREVFKLDVIVRFGSDDRTVEWPARFSRVREDLDRETRTVGIVSAIDEPYLRAIPGNHPPPLPGTFCEVEFRGRKKTRLVIVPRTAVHDSHVFVVGAGDRLERREVQTAFTQSGFVAIASGLAKDETIVISDPTPAIENMLVKSVTDDELRRQLIAAASGEGDVR